MRIPKLTTLTQAAQTLYDDKNILNTLQVETEVFSAQLTCLEQNTSQIPLDNGPQKPENE